jgi:hypothetical protein
MFVDRRIDGSLLFDSGSRCRRQRCTQRAQVLPQFLFNSLALSAVARCHMPYHNNARIITVQLPYRMKILLHYNMHPEQLHPGLLQSARPRGPHPHQ